MSLSKASTLELVKYASSSTAHFVEVTRYAINDKASLFAYGHMDMEAGKFTSCYRLPS